MTRSTLWIGRVMVVIVAFALCGAPELAHAAAQDANSQTGDNVAQNPATATGDAQDTNAPATDAQAPPQESPTGNPSSAMPDPTKGPLQPVPSANAPQQPAEAPAADQQSQQTPPPEAPQPQQRREAPLGAAAAQAGPTAGGVASRPAGTAIAPAKQRQVRSFLIKFGAVAAAGAALGVVYGLSRGTKSTPPGSGR